MSAVIRHIKELKSFSNKNFTACAKGLKVHKQDADMQKIKTKQKSSYLAKNERVLIKTSSNANSCLFCIELNKIYLTIEA